jgi:hypothetical protein
MFGFGKAKRRVKRTKKVSLKTKKIRAAKNLIRKGQAMLVMTGAAKVATPKRRKKPTTRRRY